MKSIVRIFTAILMLAAMAFTFASCKNGDENKEPTYADYTVTVIDGIGNPVSNVMVKFTGADGETKTKVTGKDGLAKLTGALEGEYDVLVEQGFSTAEIGQSTFKMNAEAKTLRVVVRDTEKTEEIYGSVEDGTYAYHVGAEEYSVPGAKDTAGYYIFRALTKGVYKFSFTSADADMTIAYYGLPMFVQDTHRGDGEYDGKSFEIIIQDISTPYVIGLNFVSGEDAVLKIERIGDAPFDPEYAPFEEIPATENFKEFNTTNLMNLNVADPNLSVSLGDDGYYYTSSGKMVYVRIDSASEYLDASIAMISGCADENFGQNFGGYIYDENGEFVGKYSYNTMIAAYYEHCDANGVYPLTEELAEAIKVHGESTGWWNPNAVNFLFSGKPYVKENAWLFLCCTEQ